MSDKKLPTPEEVQKEFEDFVRQRFGDNVQVITNPINVPLAKVTEAIGSTEDEAQGKFNLNFNMTPKQVKQYLDQYIIKQDDAKKALAIAICDHYNHVREHLNQTSTASYEYSKQNVLILGPTGVGKTYLVRKIADLIGVPFVKADATRFSETGYVGANVDDLVRDLVTQAGGDIQKAEYGIVYLDEADKLASQGNTMGRDVNGRGVQFGLLRLMEEAEIDLKSGNDLRSQMQFFMEMQKGGKSAKSVVNTANILFIVSGAFTGLEEIIHKRRSTNAIGFGVDNRHASDDEDVFKYVTTEDFIKYGFEPEFIGRLPVRVSCQHLKADDLFKILKNAKGSIIKQYISSFKAYGIDVEFSDEALFSFAEKASQEKTGARALMTVCEEILRDFKYELPSSVIPRFDVTKDLIDNPADILAQLLTKGELLRHELLCQDLRTFEQSFQERTRINISFDEGATKMIVDHCFANNIAIATYCEGLLQSYDHGLKLIQQNSGQNSFVLGVEIIQNPQGALEKLIQDFFNKAKQEAGSSTVTPTPTT